MDNGTRFGCVKFGIVKEIDPEKALARVVWKDQDLVSFWLPVIRMGSQNNKHYAMPDIGEQVVVLCDHLQEDGAIIGSIYSDVDLTPVQDPEKTHIRWKDGTVAEYDRKEHTAKFELLSGSILLQVGGTRVLLNDKGFWVNP